MDYNKKDYVDYTFKAINYILKSLLKKILSYPIAYICDKINETIKIVQSILCMKMLLWKAEKKKKKKKNTRLLFPLHICYF